MRRELSTLADDVFDVLVIGAGITGAWVALDCARRGLRVALVDRGDFGAETSSRSSRLLHGGIRYLQQFQFGKVRESALERAYWRVAAPHLSYFLPFLVPTYRKLSKSMAFLQSGLWLYRLLCLGENRIGAGTARAVPRDHRLSTDQVYEIAPFSKEGLTGGLVFFESHMYSSERMTLAVVDSAHAAGAVTVNYLEAEQPVRETDRIVGVQAHDRLSGERFDIRARVTVNATGPWVNGLDSRFAETGSRPLATGFFQGSHLVTRPLIQEYAVALTTAYAGDTLLDRGGRHVFILPWRGCSLIGTSYAPVNGSLDRLSVTRAEIDQLVNAVNQALPGVQLRESDILHTFTGIYPLQETRIEINKYQGTGEYRIVDHRRVSGTAGWITALGAKYTTARLVAEKTADLVVQQLERGQRRCQTRGLKLACADYENVSQFFQSAEKRCAGVPGAAEPRRLLQQYGSKFDQVLHLIEREPLLGKPVGEDRATLAAEVVQAVENEAAVHLEDIVLRRTGLGATGIPAPATLRRCAEIAASRTGWDAATRAREVSAVERLRFTAPSH